MRDSPFVQEHGEIISVWDSLSSNGYTHYTTLLYKDGFMSCDCPGWTIAKKDKDTGELLERACKHKKEHWNEAQMIKKGKMPKVFPQPEQRIAPIPKREGRRIDLG
jgi:hypothetical protein